ncbi:MAG: phosphohistidine phosphatase SixA [Spirochaetaceae bacterium]|nr:phosphohistidine phosphatase SixA [Spirochaetaceae bacterium]
MILYLVQHGKALSKEVDPDRPLSEEGRSEVEAVANCLARAGVRVPRIYHSGKTRAAQTARILADKLAADHVEVQSGMAPNDDVAAFAGVIEGKNRDALYVGHLPHLGKLASLLTTGDERANIAGIVNAGVLCLGTCPGGYQIEWYITPSLCVNE